MTGRRLGRGLAAAVLGACVLASVQAIAAGRPAAADPVSDCSTTVGAVVAVDFSPWDRPLKRGCAVHLSTEYAAIHQAGFTTAGDAYDGPAFVCRIDDYPPPSQQACTTTPPANAYWSFWWADAGASRWNLAEQGAMGYEPQPGSAAAWVFGGMVAQPPFPPSAVLAENTLPTTTTTSVATTTTTTTATTTTTTATTPPSTTSTTTASGAGGTTTTSSSPGTTSTAGGGQGNGAGPTTSSTPGDHRGKGGSGTGNTGSGRAAGTSGAGSQTPGTTADGAPQAAGDSPKVVDVGSKPAGTAGAGSPLPAILGLVLVLALVAAGLVIAHRRRHA